jgi:hypothetical protein
VGFLPHLCDANRAQFIGLGYAYGGMRCPSCGTENEPDSRFCGGCGARLAGALPPTQKIDTGAQPIQSPPSVQPSAQYVRAPTSQPPRSGPQSVPPASYPMAPSVNRPPSVDRPAPQGSNGAQPVPAQSMDPTSQRRKPSLSEPPPLPPKRNMALIAIVLIIDLALAGAGAYMLAEGLREPEAAPTTSSGSAVKASAAPATSAGSTAVVSPITIDAALATTTPIDAVVPADAAPPPAEPEKKPTVKKKKKPKPNPKAPVDPYDDGPPLGIPPANPDDPDS